MKKTKKWLHLVLACLLVLTGIPVNIVSAQTVAAPWPKVFSPYTNSDGTPILDPGADEHPIDLDITSGTEKGIGNLPSMYLASDGSNFFVRLRLKGNPYDRKGGFLSSVWLVKLAVGGQAKATIGLDGKSPHTDFVYVANADGTNVQRIYQTTTSGGNTVPGTRITEAENGQYFLDFQVPIQEVTNIAPEITASTPVSFFFGTSKAANLSVINKEWMNTPSSNGVSVSFDKLTEAPLNKQLLSVTIDGGNRKEYTAGTTTALAGTTSFVSGPVSLYIGGDVYNTTSQNNTWSFVLPASISSGNGTFIATASVEESGRTATATQEVVIVDKASTGMITIDGGSFATTNSTNPVISGTAGGPNGSKVQLLVDGVAMTANANNGKWSANVSLANPAEGKVYSVIAKYTNSSGNVNYATAYQKLTYKASAPSIPLPTVSISTITGDATPTIQGGSTSAKQVEVQIDNVTMGIITSSMDSWSLSLEKPLSAGTHEVRAIAVNGNGSKAAATSSYTVTNTSISIDNGLSVETNDNQPTIRGNTNAVNGSSITLQLKNKNTNETESYTTNASNGRWTVEYPLNKQLTDGGYVVTATVGSVNAIQELVIDTTTMVHIEKPLNGSSSSETKPTLSGTAEEGATVELKLTDKDNHIVLITNLTAMSQGGNWLYTLNNELPLGSYTLNAVASDRNGNVITDTSTFTVVSASAAIQSVENVEHWVPFGTSLVDAKEQLGTEVTVTLENGGQAQVPITWSEDSSPSYDGNKAGGYVFTGSFGTLPAGIENSREVSAPTGTIFVEKQQTVSIKSAGDVTKTVVNGTSLADAKTALGTTVQVELENGNKLELPITWSEDSSPSYDGNKPGDYVFTGSFGVLPEGIDNSNEAAAPRGTVTVEKPLNVSIKSAENIKKTVANGTSLNDAKASLGTTVQVVLENGAKLDVPIIWSEESTPRYDGTKAGVYVFTGSFGTLPEGIDNSKEVTAPTGTITILSNQAEIETYHFPQETKAAIIDKAKGTIDVQVKYGTQLENLTAAFTLSDRAQGVTVENVSQVSGETPNDFSKPVHYVVTAEEGNQKNWMVTVTVQEKTATPQVIGTVRSGDHYINGTSEPNAVITVKRNGQTIGTVTANETGNWTYDVPDNMVLFQDEQLTFTAEVEGKVVSDEKQITVERALSSENQIISTQFGDLDSANNVYSVPFGTKVSDFLAGLVVSDYASAVIVDETNHEVIENPENTTITSRMVIRVTAEDGSVSYHSISIVQQVTLQLTSDPKTIIGDGQSQANLKAILKDREGNPIPGVEVQFYAEAGTLSQVRAKTNDQGEATITLTSPVIEGTAIVTKLVKASIEDTERGISASDEVTITFQPPVIVGQVLDQTGKPISNALVWVEVDGQKFEAVTDSLGNYSLIVPKGGQYTVYIKVTTMVGGQEFTTIFTQEAQVQSTGQSQQYKPQRKVSGKLFVETRDHQVKTMKEMFPDSELAVHVLNDVNNSIKAAIDAEGNYDLTGFEPSKTYQVVFTIMMDGKQLAGKLSEITVGTDGQLIIQHELIDPFGIVADSVTGDPIAGVNMKIYWADTELNRANGHEPNTLVDLPELADFPPNQNKNPQVTVDLAEDGAAVDMGNYAWMVYADGDYYITAEKEGYVTYDSRLDVQTNAELGDSWIKDGIIHIGQTLMRYDVAMDKNNPVPPTEPEPSNPDPGQVEQPVPDQVKQPESAEQEKNQTNPVKVVTPEQEVVKRKLPVTATQMYNNVLLGVLLIGLGIVFATLRRKDSVD